MDVINFSGGGPQTDPRSDALIEAVRNVAAAGVVPVISAGNDRDDYGLGSAGSPGTAPDAISVAALSNSPRLRARALGDRAGAPAALTRIPFVRTAGADDSRARGRARTSTLVDVGTILGTDGQPVPRDLCGPPGNLDGGREPASRRLAERRDRARLARRLHVRAQERPREGRRRRRHRRRRQPPRRGERRSRSPLDVPGRDDRRPRRRSSCAPTSPARGGRTTVRIGGDPRDLSRPAAAASSRASPPPGSTAFGHLLKPDVGAPGGQILSSTLPSRRRPVRRLRRDEHGGAARRRRRRAAARSATRPGRRSRSSRHSSRRPAPAWADTARTVEAPVLLSGAGDRRRRRRANDPKLFTDPVSLSFGDLNVNRGAGVASRCCSHCRDAGDGAGTWTVEVKPQSAAERRRRSSSPARSRSLPAASAQIPVTARAAADAAAGEDYGFLSCAAATSTRKVPYALLVTRPGLESAPIVHAAPVPDRATRAAASRARRVYRYPAAPFGPAPNYTGAPVNEDGAETPVPDPRSTSRRERRRRGRRLQRRLARSIRGSSARRTRTTSRATPARPSTSTT